MELDLNSMEKATGGVGRTVNTGVAGLNAALRLEPRKSAKQIGSIPNGTRIDTVSDQLVYDPEAGRHFVQVNYNGKIGWVASSIVGLPR
ncbi:MAG: SH3 domain-containing protein [Clostridia bacterium]|nr:SH3 domain-containing protein [Clostridia bacterium]